MPTGYTCIIEDQDDVTFREYALRCARNFGALVHMRDDRLDAKIEKRVPCDYNEKRITEEKQRIQRVEAMSADECEREATSEYKRALASYEMERMATKAKLAKYERMREEVAAWVPPTPEHRGLGRFMLEQIDESTDFMRRYEPPVPDRQTGAQWRAKLLDNARKGIEYNERHLAEDQERCDKSNAWVAALVGSLPAVGGK